MKKNKGLLVASVFILFSIYIFVKSLSIVSTSGAALGPAFMPRVVAISLFILGILDFVAELKKKRQLEQSSENSTLENAEKEQLGTNGLNRVQGFLVKYIDYVSGGLILIYAFCVKPLGFIVASSLYMLVQMLLLTIGRKRNYLLLLLLAVGVPTGVYYLFVKVFYLMLPVGILG